MAMLALTNAYMWGQFALILNLWEFKGYSSLIYH